jgi:RNA polymerase sigma-70 factor (TIGR02943 family)
MTQVEKEAGFRQWVDEYSNQLYNYALQRRFDVADARDLLQETFLAAWRNMDNYKGQASVKNWLFIILKSKITDHFRKSANKAIVESIHSDHNDDAYFDAKGHWAKGAYPKPLHIDFDNAMEAKEFQDALLNCSSKLKQIQNTVFVMKYVDGLKSEEICNSLGISTSNYWVIIHRAKVQLRACLQKNWMNK